MEDEKYLKRQRFYKIVMLVVLTAFLTFIFTTIYITKKYNLSDGDQTISSLFSASSSSDDKLTKSLKNIKSILKKYYLNDIDEDKAIDGAIEGYVSSLGDQYTEYIPKDEMEDYTQNLMGNYVGIGIYMSQNTKDNTIVVLTPIKYSPAEEAGILPGDIIKKINDVEYTGENMTAAANNIKGAEGTKVKLEIQRGQEIKTFEITRKKITTNPVIAEKLDNNIGYLEVTSFDENTAENFKSKYEELKAQGIDSLIIDLRNNGGGLVEEALKIADYIVPKGKELLVTVDKDGKEKVEKSKEDVLIDMPIVVLVNKNSASSSEILAGALKDLNEATIVGTTTYGKGVIQQFLTLRDGSGLKVTVEEYYTPNRTKINGVGIEPNEKIELPETITNPLTVERKDDTQLQKAIELLKK
ncbi:carboxyl-terminal protease [Clostridium sp. CAG:356]|jgi:peptidase, S41 family|nr:MAG: hypothetical protein BHW02_03515 [Clostridium sp. 28_12]CDD36682.1 carboxyl-terminal protease [Clostridium sp. CAG:356]